MTNFRHQSILAACIFIWLMTGCATGLSTHELIRIRLDMTKDQVISAIGEPSAARGSIRNKYGQVIELWEYQLRKPENEGNMYTYNWKYPYWLYFYDGRLVQWGAAGDWQKEADRIYEMRFK